MRLAACWADWLSGPGVNYKIRFENSLKAWRPVSFRQRRDSCSVAGWVEVYFLDKFNIFSSMGWWKTLALTDPTLLNPAPSCLEVDTRREEHRQEFLFCKEGHRWSPTREKIVVKVLDAAENCSATIHFFWTLGRFPIEKPSICNAWAVEEYDFALSGLNADTEAPSVNHSRKVLIWFKYFRVNRESNPRVLSDFLSFFLFPPIVGECFLHLK